MNEQERKKRLQRRREERDFYRCLLFFGSGVGLTVSVVGLAVGNVQSALIVALCTLVAGIILWAQTPEVE